MGRISIDSSVLESVVTNVNSDKAKLEEVKSSLDSAFAPLTNCGLFEGCLSSLKEEVTNIASTYDVLASSISSHLSDATTIENQVQNVGSNYMSYYTPGTGGGGSNVHSGDDSQVLDVDDGNSVDPEKMEDKIKDLDIKSITNMVTFACLIKGNTVSLMSLLFDPTKAGDFAKILKKFYSTYGVLEVKYDDASKVQKEFVKKILNSNEDLPVNLTEITILQFKKYLVNIAKNNNINPEDLVLDESNKEILTTALKDLYAGNVDKDKFNDEYCTEFQAFVNTKASSLNISADDVMGNITNLL